MTDEPREQRMSTAAVKGYKEASGKKVAQVNFHKALEERIIREIETLEKSGCDGPADPRWLKIAATQIQQGFMALNRAIFNPGRLSDEDIAQIRDERT
jgi:hypothetical protein